ncbi:MAG: hypothetical protein WD025_00800, partial [Bacteriovoracaceae bacterium]
LYSFEIKTEKDLYFETVDIKWKSIFNVDQTFKIQVLQGKSPDGKKRSKFKNAMYLGQVVKDAIVDRFRKDVDKRPDVDKDDPDAPLLIRVEPNNNPHSQKETVTINLDMCGQALSNRGYRKVSVQAPLRENLAAGMVLKAGLGPDEDFYNPMCGSGTILTEGLLLKGEIPPSFLRVKNHLETGQRPWSFLSQNFYVKDKYLKQNTEKFFQEVLEQTALGMERLINNKSKNIAIDLDQRAVDSAKANLAAAGLESLAKLEKQDALNYEIPNFKGKIVVNPPYGERLEKENLEELYREFGERLKNSFKDSEAFVLTANLELIKKIQLQTKERMIIYNGNLESRLLHYNLF